MAMKCSQFFETGTSNQFEWILKYYDECLKLKAHDKSSKPENVIKLDKWYQNELPKKIKSRGKDPHLLHDEIVQTIKWKLARGKYRPNLTNLVQMNTPRVVMQETKKAFRKLAKTQDVQAALLSLCNLKGVGPAMASAILSAGAPQLVPYMADECLLSMPDVESLDYTTREYMKYVEYVNKVVERLNAEGGKEWDPHNVELAVWTHYVANDLKPELLLDMPQPTSSALTESPASATTTNGGPENNTENPVTNGEKNGSSDEDATKENGDKQSKGSESNTNGRSKESSETPVSTDSDNTNDSATNDENSAPTPQMDDLKSSQKRPLEKEANDDSSEIIAKKAKEDDKEELQPQEA